MRMEIIEKTDNFPKAIARYSITLADVTEIAARYKTLSLMPDDRESYKKCKTAKMELCHLRSNIEKRRKELGAEAREYLKDISEAAVLLIGILAPVENRLSEDLESENKRVLAIAAEKIQVEKERTEKIKKNITDIRETPLNFVGKTAAEIQSQIDTLSCLNVELEWFEEFTLEAAQTKETTLESLKRLLGERLLADSIEKQNKVEAKRIEKIRLEQATEAARIETERRAIEKEKAEMVAAKKAEQARQDKEELEKTFAIEAKAKAELEARGKAEREEKERIERVAHEEAEKARQEALQPDKEKLVAWAYRILNTRPPRLSLDAAKLLAVETKEQLVALGTSLQCQAQGL